ncbi:MAG: hypothetical protein ABW252_09880 [Polyangiales bacterium]
MNNRIGLLAALSFAALGAYIGCGGGGGGGDDDNGGGDPAPGGSGGQTGDLEIVFNPMYSGFDGVHTYQIPVKTTGVKNATFTAADPSLVTIEKDGDGVLITTKKAGETTITATAGGLKGTAKLTITNYTAAQWTAGESRYNNGEPFKLPEFDPCNPPRTPPTISNKLSCTNCHGVTGSLGDVKHTPTQIGGYSDEQLIQIFTNATKPEGVGQHTPVPAQIWKFFHKWEVNETERPGIIAYLRSLPPRETGTSSDFGGSFRGDGGFQIPRCDGGTPTGGGSDAGVADGG